MKKLLSLMLAAAMAVSVLSGCSGDNGSSSTADSGEVTGTVVLKIAHNMDFVTIPDAVLAAGERLNEKYAAEGRDLKIEFETDYQSIDWTEYHNNVIFAQKNGEGPDIFSLDSDVAGFVKAGMLLDISDMMTDDFVENIYTPFMVDGKAYGMPFDLPVRVIYYNKAALKEIGWTDEQVAALPQQMASGEFTWEQFLDLCAEVQSKGAAEWGLAHRPGAGSDFLDVLMTLGGEYVSEDGKLLFDNEGILRFFQEIYDNANTTKITPTNLSQMGWPTINAMVGDGTAFAYYGPIYSATYVAGAVDKTPEQFAEDVGFAVFPASQYNSQPFCIAAPQGMGINANTQYPEICKDLFRELYCGDSVDQLAHHADTIFTLSSVKAANEMEDIKTNPILKEVGYMADLSISEPNVEGITTYTSEMHKQIQLLELGQTTPEKALEDFRTQIEINLDADQVEYK
ncbi:MAG: extracellular solute-binding protein [Clostridiales bacterium]|nr:extracellular solute-binding protein [Clostridiales bacterium]